MGIGVGAGVGALLIAALIFAVWWYRRKAKANKAVAAANATSGNPAESQAMQQQPVIVGEIKIPELPGYYVPQQPPSSTPSPHPYNAAPTPVSPTSTVQPQFPGATVAPYNSVSPPPQSVVEADSREIAGQPQNQHQYQAHQQLHSPPPAHAQLNTQYYQQAGQSPQPSQQAQQPMYPQHPNIPELSGN